MNVSSSTLTKIQVTNTGKVNYQIKSILYMPFGFGKKDESQNTMTDSDSIREQDEINKISERLDSDERVLVVARQSRVVPGGKITTPSIIFATNKRLIIRDPSLLGLRESIDDLPYYKITSARLEKGVFSSSVIIRAAGISTMSEKTLGLLNFAKKSNEGQIDAIPKEKAEKIIEIIKRAIDFSKNTQGNTMPNTNQSSMADELIKLAKLKQDGVISEE